MAHKHIQRGNAAFAIAKSKHVLTRQFYTPYTEHAFLEPECAVAYPDGDGVMILSTDQSAYDTQHETAPMLGLPMELYTPLFAVARIAGWSAHRMEELSAGGKLIRPRYECVEPHRSYTDMGER